jgi:hypothetical protein
VLDGFVASVERTNRRNDTQHQLRTGLDEMARQLRNLASPTPNQPQAVDKATPYDLVFQTVDPTGPNAGANTTNVRRVRYCLDAGDPSATLWMQGQTWTQSTPPAAPASGACPDPDARWTTTGKFGDGVVNRSSGRDRPVWAYNAEDPTRIVFLRMTLFVDTRPGREPGESTLSTGVFLRNQNRAPVAEFTATATGDRHVLLNGSSSYDPEGKPLSYDWYDGATLVGSGITVDYRAPAIGVRNLSLRIVDPAGLRTDAPAQAVTVR